MVPQGDSGSAVTQTTPAAPTAKAAQPAAKDKPQTPQAPKGGQPAEAPPLEESKEPQEPSQEPGKAPPGPGEAQPEGEKPPEAEEPAVDPATAVRWEDAEGTKYDATLQDLQLGWEWAARNYKATQEAQERLQKVDDFFGHLEKDPLGTLTHFLAQRKFGGNRDQGYQAVLVAAGEALKRYDELQKMPEADRRVLELQSQIEADRAEKERLKQALLEREEEEDNLRRQARIRARIEPALEKVGLPKDEYHRELVADVLLRCLEGGFHNVTPEMAAKRIRDQLSSREEDGLKTRPVDEILKIRPELEEYIVKKSLKEAGAKASARIPASASNGPAQKKPGPRVYSDSAFEEFLNR